MVSDGNGTCNGTVHPRGRLLDSGSAMDGLSPSGHVMIKYGVPFVSKQFFSPQDVYKRISINKSG